MDSDPHRHHLPLLTPPWGHDKPLCPPPLYASPALRPSSCSPKPREGPPLGAGGGGRGAGREQSPARRLAGARGFLLTLLLLAPTPPPALPPPAPAGVSASQQLPGTGASRALEEPLLPLCPPCHQRKNLPGHWGGCPVSPRCHRGGVQGLRVLRPRGAHGPLPCPCLMGSGDNERWWHFWGVATAFPVRQRGWGLSMGWFLPMGASCPGLEDRTPALSPAWWPRCPQRSPRPRAAVTAGAKPEPVGQGERGGLPPGAVGTHWGSQHPPCRPVPAGTPSQPAWGRATEPRSTHWRSPRVPNPTQVTSPPASPPTLPSSSRARRRLPKG